MKNTYLFIILQCLSGFMFSQVITFEQIYEAPQVQNGLDGLATAGGYLIVGTTTNNVANDLDLRVLKTDKFGDTLWTKIYPGPDLYNPSGMLQIADSNYFIVGATQMPGSNQLTSLIKINSSGDIIWSKTYGGSATGSGNEIVATSDGKYMITGGYNGDAYLMKIDSAGTILWTKYYGGSATYESSRSVKQCADKGFILTGKTASTELSQDAKIYIVKTDSVGDTTWTKTYGGPDSYEGKFIVTNSDGTYTLCIDDSSKARDSDVRVMKISATGDSLINKRYGGVDKDISKMIQHTTDGGYILAGISRSFGWINPKMWVLKFNSTLDTTWSAHYGSYWHSHCYAVRQTADGGYMAVGHTEGSSQITQIMLVKTDSLGHFSPASVQELSTNNTINIYPNPTAGKVQIDLLGTDLSGSIIKIVNGLGQEVFSEIINTSGQNESRSVDLKNNNPGMYFLSIQSAKCLTTRKLVLQ